MQRIDLPSYPYQALDEDWQPFYFPEPLPSDPDRDTIAQRRYRIALVAAEAGELLEQLPPAIRFILRVIVSVQNAAAWAGKWLNGRR